MPFFANRITQKNLQGSHDLFEMAVDFQAEQELGIRKEYTDLDLFCAKNNVRQKFHAALTAGREIEVQTIDDAKVTKVQIAAANL